MLLNLRIGEPEMRDGLGCAPHRQREGRYLLQRLCQGFGMTREECTGCVGEKLAPARDRKTQERRRNRRQNQRTDEPDKDKRPAAAAAISPRAAETSVKTHTNKKIRESRN